MKSFLVPDNQDRRAGAHERAFIGIDASIDLPMAEPIAQLGPGELFGEMTCRTFQPRSATVRALETVRHGRDAPGYPRYARGQPTGFRREQSHLEGQGAHLQGHILQGGDGSEVS